MIIKLLTLVQFRAFVAFSLGSFVDSTSTSDSNPGLSSGLFHKWPMPVLGNKVLSNFSCSREWQIMNFHCVGWCGSKSNFLPSVVLCSISPLSCSFVLAKFHSLRGLGSIVIGLGTFHIYCFEVALSDFKTSCKWRWCKWNRRPPIWLQDWANLYTVIKRYKSLLEVGTNHWKGIMEVTTFRLLVRDLFGYKLAGSTSL